MASMLYDLLIGPLELFFEIVFAVAYRVVHHPGLAIIALSLVMNFLVLPLYKRADAMQAEERDLELKLKPWVTHIKKTFTGDERFMILQTYYRQNNYKPTYALKGSLSLLLEIPFFIAAYNLLSGLALLEGVSFGPIKDLGAADGLLQLGGWQINVLPVLMTLINIVSGMIYTRGMSAKSKIQLYGMAVIFLVFLYDSPAGLVFYWTLNNLFSLVKNVFYKLKNPKKVLGILASAAGFALLAFVVLFFPDPKGNKLRQKILAGAVAVLLQLPLMIGLLQKKFGWKTLEPVRITGKDKATFFLGTAFLTILTGVLIPSAVIHDSPAEFFSLATGTPLLYVLHAFLLAAGFFLIWCGIFYMLASPAGKKLMGYAAVTLCIAAVIDYMFFGTGYGNLSPALKFDRDIDITLGQQAVNVLVLLAAAGMVWLLYRKKDELLRMTCLAGILAMVVMSVFNMTGIQSVISGTREQLEQAAQRKASIPLSREGKNVVVLMMDRAVSKHLPYIFQEKPEVAQQFAGFTYYPNTMSFGQCTNMGVPAVYGGYEYTPEEMNRRDQEPLQKKHDEALKVMPVLFDQADFQVTVCDPTYAGYNWIPDLHVYDDYPDIDAYITMGRFSLDPEAAARSTDQLLNRNLFCYSLFKIAPVTLQPTLYCSGTYNEPDQRDSVVEQIQKDLYHAQGLRRHFMDSYAVLNSLPRLTKIRDDAQDTFLMMSNDTTHEPVLLQMPNYEPALKVDNSSWQKQQSYVVDGQEMKMETLNQVMHYHINMAAMIQLGSWMDYLRENDVYDNTRIIIVADHGRSLKQFDDIRFGKWAKEDVMIYNPLLLVKDFGSTEFRTDDTFMTNADVAVLATRDLIDHPVNPFTGKPITSDAKNAPEQHIIFSTDWDIDTNHGNTFLPGDWYAVHDDIFDLNNWRKLN